MTVVAHSVLGSPSTGASPASHGGGGSVVVVARRPAVVVVTSRPPAVVDSESAEVCVESHVAQSPTPAAPSTITRASPTSHPFIASANIRGPASLRFHGDAGRSPRHRRWPAARESLVRAGQTRPVRWPTTPGT
jgi:hypothetical protein